MRTFQNTRYNEKKSNKEPVCFYHEDFISKSKAATEKQRFYPLNLLNPLTKFL